MNNTQLKKGQTYSIVDPLSPHFGYPDRMAVWDGLPRHLIKRGQHFLSGARIECYMARRDMPTPYHGARIVEVGPPITTRQTLRTLE